MGKVNVFCVRMGTFYGPEYVERLRNMVLRHSKGWDVSFWCITDQTDTPEGWHTVKPMGPHSERWWAKMELFNTELRGDRQSVYFDLDTVIVGDLGPLFSLKLDFGICANFTRAVQPDYPCAYGSCVMTLGPGWGDGLWSVWQHKWQTMVNQAGVYGDQWAIGKFYPMARLLQDALKPSYFVGRRAFTDKLPPGAAIMVFAGKVKPHTSKLPWVKEHWA